MTILLFLCVFVFLATSSAFIGNNRALHSARSTALSEKSESWVMDFLSGKTAVAAEKRSSPELFGSPTKKRVIKKVKIGPNAEKAISIYKKSFPNPKAGGTWDLDESAVAYYFYEMAKFTKSEEVVLEMMSVVPDIVTKNVERSKANFEIYTETYGFDEAIGLITRNPNILAVPTRGYGSAEVAKEDAMAMSYVIAFTRPLGAPLLALLFSALLTPFIKSLNLF
mmetsp:Transcript_21777/g.36420  ORF Transcript_21777/g.36420 Transcript_21777/m.36420 type:complete len:224 (-) Transcript_21777:102-773(-)